MKRLYPLFLAFMTGAIIMAYVADYNRSQLPIATVCLVVLTLQELIDKK